MIKKTKNDEHLNQKHNLQKFNVEKCNEEVNINNNFNNNLEKKYNNNNIKICEQCKSIVNSFSLNKNIIKLLFNQQNHSFILQNNSSSNSFINNLLKNPNICSNCLKNFLNNFYFKDNNTNNNKNNITFIENEIIKMIQVLENMNEEKLNNNVKIYHSYKKLINSFIEYIKDNHENNEYNENEYDKTNSLFFNIKNQELIGVDCMLNIIDLLNKNISLIKEKNTIKNNFFKEIINEKNMLINDIIKNKNQKYENSFNFNFNLDNNNENIKKIINDSDNENNNSKNNKLVQLNKKGINTKKQNLFKTKIIKTKNKNKNKRKRFKRMSHKIKFTIKTK